MAPSSTERGGGEGEGQGEGREGRREEGRWVGRNWKYNTIFIARCNHPIKGSNHVTEGNTRL